MKLERAQQPKTYTSFYTPKERYEARRRSSATVAVLAALIAVLVIVRAVS